MLRPADLQLEMLFSLPKPSGPKTANQWNVGRTNESFSNIGYIMMEMSQILLVGPLVWKHFWEDWFILKYNNAKRSIPTHPTFVDSMIPILTFAFELCPPKSIHFTIITDSVVLWKIQKFDWLIPETNWHSCLHNKALWSYLATLRLLRQRENNPQFSGTY